LKPDFHRKVHCVLGLPFDLLDEEEAIERVRESAQSGRPCFFSTPNLSFATAVQRDAALRDSVIRSDMSVPDGMPLIWAARLMGVPTKGRVAGSSMFERLWHRPKPGARPLKVFFFGGADGVAARASEAINGDLKGVQCVGFESPGFGSVEAMSGDELIGRINASGADFIVVSIGVAKGQAWIERNRERLSAPVISYLGAVVNFVAGNVQRAPRAFQRLGLEWLWRIKEEPALWRRYANDGRTYLGLLAGSVIPYRWNALWHTPAQSQLASASAKLVQEGGRWSLRLAGCWDARNADKLRPLLGEAAEVQGLLHIDLSECRWADSEVIALISLLWAFRQTLPWDCSVHAVQPRLLRMMRCCRADYLLNPVPHAAAHTLVLEKK
jgi:N-acetylglucosaminyldiphosphoundecaprenol N-acetyl-beta-D-mannosaminyltransferase